MSVTTSILGDEAFAIVISSITERNSSGAVVRDAAISTTTFNRSRSMDGANIKLNYTTTLANGAVVIVNVSYTVMFCFLDVRGGGEGRGGEGRGVEWRGGVGWSGVGWGGVR